MNRDRRRALRLLQVRLQETGLSDAMAQYEAIKDELEALRDEEETAVDNLPVALQTDDALYPLTQINEALQQMEAFIDGVDMDALDEAFSAIDNAKGEGN